LGESKILPKLVNLPLQGSVLLFEFLKHAVFGSSAV
jgi:hypothetical protein